MDLQLLSEESSGLVPLAVALAVGLIIGFERGWHGQERREGEQPARRRGDGDTVAGIRTFSLVGLLGGVVALLAGTSGPLLLVAGLLAVGLLLTAGYVLTSLDSRDFGATTEFALLLTFTLGALAGTGHMLEAAASAVVAAVLLGFKEEIHTTLGRLERREVHASLQLLVIALVVLPLLPNRPMGPWDSLNPRTIGLLVMLIAGIGFVGYFAVRIIGPRAGLLLTALLGGLTSSTAVTVAFARLSRRPRASHALLGVGIALACGTMAPRVLIEVAAVNATLVPLLLPGLLALAVVPLLAAALIVRRHGRSAQAGEVGIDNPLEVRQALIIGVLLAVVFMLTHGAEALFGNSGVYWLAALSGIADVDAVALALAAQARGSLDNEVAARAILLAALVNTAAKATIAAVIGGRELARWSSSVLLLALVAGAATMPFI